MAILEEAIIIGSESQVESILSTLNPCEIHKILCAPSPKLELKLLNLAAFQGNVAIVRLFINSLENKSLLHEVLYQKHLPEGVIPLYLAAQQGHKDVVVMLLNCFDYKNERLNYQRQSAESNKRSPFTYCSRQ